MDSAQDHSAIDASYNFSSGVFIGEEVLPGAYPFVVAVGSKSTDQAPRLRNLTPSSTIGLVHFPEIVS